MMRFTLLFLVFASMAMAQETNAPPAAPQARSATAPSPATKNPREPGLSPNAAVITIKGMCNSSSAAAKEAAGKSMHGKTGADCKTIITRSEFEQLVDALQVPPAARKQFATQYTTALMMANEARKRGLDRGSRYEELLKIARLQVSTRQLGQNLQEQSAKISDKEVSDYYHGNLAAYQEATLERLYIPRVKQQEPSKGASEADTKKQQEDSEAAMKKEADDLHSQAAAGGDFAKLQEEAYKFANFKASPPQVKMEKVRQSSLPPQQAAVMGMKPEEVSQVFSDAGGYFIYKLDQKDTIPLDRVHDEIRASLQKQKLQDAMQAIQQSATPSFNESYFASASTSPQPRIQGSMPGSAHSPDNHSPATNPPARPD